MDGDSSFADLEIRILPKDASGYPIEITFNGEIEFPRGNLSPQIPDLKALRTSNQVGEALFDWLFESDSMKTSWANATGLHPRRRIRLRIDPGTPELHALPWESLKQPGGLHLATVDSTPFSRYIAGPWVPGSPILERPIRVLVAVANPANLPDFDLAAIDAEHEFNLLQNAVAGNSDIELIRLNGPCTLPVLEAALRNNIHALHFVGHGQFINSNAYLMLCDPKNTESALAVKDTLIVEMIARQLANGALRLVYLSSCQTASRSQSDSFLGLAPKLVAAGIPAVLAMQDLVPIVTATEFSQTFYRELIAHGQIDRASNSARASILTAGLPGSSIPVLFLRLRNGQLFGNRGVILGARGESFWNTLLDNIAEKECTPFIGPGLTSSLLPSPEDLARQLAAKFHYPFPNRLELPLVTQFIGTIDNRRLRKQVLTVLIERFHKAMGLPLASKSTLTQSIDDSDWANTSRALFENEPHHLLADLDLPLYLTTNFDNFMTHALQARTNGNARREILPWRESNKKRSDLLPTPTPGSPVVLHLFGSDTDLASLVITEDDHLDYLAQVSRDHDFFLPVYVNERLASTTLLFLGYQLGNLDLKIILRGLLHNLSLAQWEMLNVAVQLESSHDNPAQEKEVIDYFQKYFAKSKIDIYWGSTHQFLADLSARWKEHRRG